MDATTDADLIAAYLAGDHNAFTKIYKRYSPILRRTARLKLYDKHACDDILQDVFLIAAKKLQDLHDRERLPQWLQQILVREVYRYNTKGLRLVATDFQSNSPSHRVFVIHAPRVRWWRTKNSRNFSNQPLKVWENATG